MKENTLQAKVLSENVSYQKTYPILLRWIMVTGISAFVLLLLIGYYIFYPPQAKYFIVYKNNQEAAITALNYPIVSRSEILRWSSQSVISIYNFDFNNWEIRLKAAAPLFTSNGFARFQGALRLDGVLSGVVDQKLQVTSVVTAPPVIIAEGVLGGRYTWKVSMPVLLTYISSSESRQRSIIVTMVVSRIPVSDSPRGYAIAQFYEESA